MLGTGTSHGVPMIGCDCSTCRSIDPRDTRTRPSILIERSDLAGEPVPGEVASILVDTSTDLRMQALTRRVRRVDAILFTHSHADHIFGLDELRRFIALKGGGTLTVHGASSVAIRSRSSLLATSFGAT